MAEPVHPRIARNDKMMRWLRSLTPLRFRGQAMLFLFPMILIISAVFTLESIVTQRAMLRNELIKRGETIAAIAAGSAELPLLSENLEQLRNSALTLMETQDVRYVRFYNKRSDLLLHASQRKQEVDEGKRAMGRLSPLAAGNTLQVVENGATFDFIVPVQTVKAAEELFLFEGEGSPPVTEQIGWVSIGLSKDVMLNAGRKIIVRGALLGIVFALGGGLLLYLFITLATRPLYALIHAVKEVREGEHPEVTVARPESELGMLCTEFNRMSRAIKEREDELRSHRDHLEDLVQARTGELTIAKEQAESANRAKSDFLSSMSHELRTPLNAILGYAQILRLQNNLSSAQRQQVDIMRSSGEHLLMLINDILDVGRIEANKAEIEEIAFDLPALVRQVFDLTRLQAEEKGLCLAYEEATPLPSYVRGDERKLRQVLLNLLSNAVKYTRKGSVTMRVGYDRSASDLFRCEVADTGIGIPADKRETIFEPFTQLGRDREASQGTGLGLNITKRLLELMQGRIEIESAEGVGSTFRFEVRLPLLADADYQAERKGPRITGYRGERKRILVIDDSIRNAFLLVSLLEPLGFELATAQGGEEALERAEQHRPHLILLDLVMQGMDGVETARRLRGNPMLDSSVLIGTSATLTESSLKNAFWEACDEVLPKPIHLDLLLETIGGYLDLEWVTAPQPLVGDNNCPAGDEPVRLPAPSEVNGLHDLAQLGDMEKVEAWARAFSSRHPEHAGFADRLMGLAGKFRTKEILALVEQCRGDGNGH